MAVSVDELSTRAVCNTEVAEIPGCSVGQGKPAGEQLSGIG
jgi:hypothetical protein